MNSDGLKRVLDFLDILDKENVHYQIDQVRPDAILVFFTLVGLRVEIDFFVDRMTYRCFKGHEDVHVDESMLMDLIQHHIREEEGEMFVAAREALNEDQLRELGDMMQSRKETLLAMWEHPLLRPVKKLQGVAHKMLPAKIKNAKVNAIATAMEGRR